MADTHQGSCFRGAVAFEVPSALLEMGYCHCVSCRAYSGGPFKAFTPWRAENVRVTQGAEWLSGFNKTGMSHGRFCKQCGGHLMVEHPGMGLTDLHAGKFRPWRSSPRCICSTARP